jgi:hypothetical protein
MGHSWTIEQYLDEAQSVRCPNCGIEYIASEAKFFGFLSREAFVGLIIFFIFCMLFALAYEVVR